MEEQKESYYAFNSLNKEFQFFEDFENNLLVIHKFTFTIKLLISKISKRLDFDNIVFILFLVSREDACSRKTSLNICFLSAAKEFRLLKGPLEFPFC